MAQNRGQQGQKQPGGGVKIELITDKDAPIQDTNTQEWVKWIEIRASKGGAMIPGATARIKKGVRVITTVFLAKGEAVYEHREPDSAQGEQIELRISLDDGSAAEEKVSFTIPKLPTAPPTPATPGSQPATSQTAQQQTATPAPKTCKCKKTGCGEDIPEGTKFCPKCGQDQNEGPLPILVYILLSIGLTLEFFLLRYAIHGKDEMGAWGLWTIVAAIGIVAYLIAQKPTKKTTINIILVMAVVASLFAVFLPSKNSAPPNQEQRVVWQTVFKQMYVGKGYGEDDYLLTVKFGEELKNGDKLIITGFEFEDWDNGRWNKHSDTYETINQNSSNNGKLGVRAPLGIPFMVEVKRQ